MVELLNRICDWSAMSDNALIGMDLAGALLLGMLVGYERSYRGRAAGMRTYGLVSMASAALTLIARFAPLSASGAFVMATGDPIRTVQGIVTGVGFLCAGVIVKDGMTIRGLTTAASIWTVAAMGVLVGVGLYESAILLGILATASMAFLHRLENKLPGRSTAEVTLTFRRNFQPAFAEVRSRAEIRGYEVAAESLSIAFADHQQIWKFCVVAIERSKARSLAVLAEELVTTDGVNRFSIAPIRS
jgi:putative Mg2+ transporter-C (MgtC) family protein